MSIFKLNKIKIFPCFFRPKIFGWALIFGAGFLFFGLSSASAATYYWVGGTTNASTSNPVNWKTTSGACADSANVNVPGVSDSVIFTSSCVNNATVDSAFTVSQFWTNSGYTGIITIDDIAASFTTEAYMSGGTLNVQNGGTLSSGSFLIAYVVGSTSEVNIIGSGSSWAISGQLHVGYNGTGELNILNGATVTSTATGISAVTTGYAASASGTLTVDGLGSQFTNSGSGRVRVGDSGSGAFNITNGATATTGNVYAAYNLGSVGTITVDGSGSTWNSDTAGSLGYIGRNGTATLTISNGAVVTTVASPWQIGGNAGSFGTVNITGTGSQLNATVMNLRVGFSGTGTLTLENGAAVNGQTITVAALAGSTGTLTVGTGYTTDIIDADLVAGLGTASLAPSQPANLTSTENTQTTLLWDWDDESRATGYKIYNASGGALLATISSAVSYWTQETLLPNTEYSIYVRGTNAQGEGAASSDAASRTASPPSVAVPVQWYSPPALPQEGPGFSFSINDNAESTLNSAVSLNLKAGPDTAKMVVSNFSDFRDAGQEAFASFKDWNICWQSSVLKIPAACPAGSYTVWAKFYTAWGVASGVVSDTIVLKISDQEQTAPNNQSDGSPEESNELPDNQNQTGQTNNIGDAPAIVNLNDIAREAKLLSESALNEILSSLGIPRNFSLEQTAAGYAIKIIGSEIADIKIIHSLTNFIAYGAPTTKILGTGERAGTINSFKEAFGKLPVTESDWSDVIKIANGRWPSQKNAETEQNATEAFKKIYLRNPDRNNSADDAAVTIISYGLRPAQRNLNSEKQAIQIFRNIYGYAPESASAWDIIRAIAYSGAKR